MIRLGALLFIISLCTAKAQHGNNAEKLYASAWQLYQEGRYQAAADSVQKAGFLYEKSGNLSGQVKSLNLLGECKTNQSQCEEALASLTKSLELTQANFKPISVEAAEVYYYLSRAYGGCARNFQEAIPNVRKSMSLKQQLFGEGPEVALNYAYLGYIFTSDGKFDSASYYLHKSLAIQKKYLARDDVDLANTLYHLGRNHQDKGELSKALDYLQQSLSIRAAKLNDSHPNISNNLQQLGSVYQKMGNIDRALDYYKKSLAIRIKSLGPNHVNVAASYWSIGNLYGNIFNYHQAIDYTRQGNAIMQAMYGDKSDLLPTYDAFLGRMYSKIGDHASALASFNLAQRRVENNLDKDHLYRGIVYNIIGEYYAEIKDSNKAMSYLNKALAIFRKAGGANAVREADVLTRIASINVDGENFKNAHQHYTQALELYQSKMGGKTPKVATVHQFIGDAYAAQGQFKPALISYQKGLAAIATDFNDTSIFANPAIERVDNKALALRIVIKKAQALSKWARHADDLQQGFQTFLYAIDLGEDLIMNFELESSKVELKKEISSLYHLAMESAYQLYTATGSTQYIDYAFAISEKSKAMLLLENMRDEEAKFLAGVPDSLVRRENDLEIALAYHRSQLYRAQTIKDTATIAINERTIFDLQQKYELLKGELEKKFTAYFNIRHNPFRASLADVQNALPEGASMIEFFTGDQYIFTLSIDKGASTFSRINKDSTLLTLLSDYHKSLTDVDFIINSNREADRLYTNTAHQLYTLFLKSVVEKNPGITHLVIIPDDRMAQLNFGTLLTQPHQGTAPDYKTLNYVASRWRTSYAYSAQWLHQNRSITRKAKKEFGGFAPSYQTDNFSAADSINHPLTYLVMRSGNFPLPGAVEEVKSISQLMRGDSWINEEATETNFKTSASLYHVLHLAMHTLIDNEKPQFSELLFNHDSDTVNDGYLTVAEIYNLKLNASMAVLSACRSGFGKIQAGEGPISISRAFSYAGCPSVVMSYWKVPDEVTSKIMINFYEELSKGTPKDEALRLAQFKFLNETTNPMYRHPYFWAGIVVMGDTQPLPEPTSYWVYFVLIGSIAFALTAFLFWRKQRAT
jgi:CHAT domain-containing protein/lipopolysaccharide biosynthesis regulator YciM